MGRTTLQLPIKTQVFDRDFAGDKKKWEEARAKAAAAAAAKKKK